MIGKFLPGTENPAPEIQPALMVTGAVPLEVNITDIVTVVPTATLPNAREAVLAFSAGTTGFSWIAKLIEMELALADNVAACGVVTEETVAVKDAEYAPDGTVTLAGTATALLSLDRVTRVPSDGDAELSVTVHVVNPCPRNELLSHVSALKDAVDSDEDAVLPRLIDVDFDVATCIASKVAGGEAARADRFADCDCCEKHVATMPETTIRMSQMFHICFK